MQYPRTFVLAVGQHLLQKLPVQFLLLAPEPSVAAHHRAHGVVWIHRVRHSKHVPHFVYEKRSGAQPTAEQLVPPGALPLLILRQADLPTSRGNALAPGFGVWVVGIGEISTETDQHVGIRVVLHWHKSDSAVEYFVPGAAGCQQNAPDAGDGGGDDQGFGGHARRLNGCFGLSERERRVLLGMIKQANPALRRVLHLLATSPNKNKLLGQLQQYNRTQGLRIPQAAYGPVVASSPSLRAMISRQGPALMQERLFGAANPATSAKELLSRLVSTDWMAKNLPGLFNWGQKAWSRSDQLGRLALNKWPVLQDRVELALGRTGGRWPSSAWAPSAEAQAAIRAVRPGLAFSTPQRTVDALHWPSPQGTYVPNIR